MSCLCPERREEPRDMTDYRQGQRSRPKPRLQLSGMGAGKGGWGTKRGHKQKRQVLVKESRKERGETPPTHTNTHDPAHTCIFLNFLDEKASFFFFTRDGI